MSGPPPYVPQPWHARVVRTHRWRYELIVTSGMLALTRDGGNPASWGGLDRAVRKAQRIVDRQNARDARRRAAEAAATEVR